MPCFATMRAALVATRVWKPMIVSRIVSASCAWSNGPRMRTSGSCGKARVLCGGEGRYGIATWPMMGSTDQAFAALIEDMDTRRLIDAVRGQYAGVPVGTEFVVPAASVGVKSSY